MRGTAWLVFHTGWADAGWTGVRAALQGDAGDSTDELSRLNDQGRWSVAPSDPDADGTDEAQRLMIARLEAIGYAAGVQPARDTGGVEVLDPGSAYPGAALYVSGHAPEARLIGVDGSLLHRWHFAMEDAWPDYEPTLQTPRARFFFRRAHLFPNGDLLVIFEGYGMIKIDRDSRLLWARRNRAHHDLDVLDNGDIYVLTRTAHVVPSLDPKEPKLEDYIVGLHSDGTEFFRLSLIEALAHSPWREFIERPVIERPDPRLLHRKASRIERGDLFHTNAIEIVREDHPSLPWLRAGNAIVSLRFLSAILVVDLESSAAVWFHQGDFVGQHDPNLLANGHLLLFDNGADDRSRVIEIDPADGSLVWEYPGAAGTPFYSECCGTTTRLPNGNTQIVATEPGFVREVTPDGRTVWEYHSPHRAGDHDELVAALFDVVRLPENFPLDWVQKPL